MKFYKPIEIESAGEEKRKLESYQYRIARELAQEIEDSIQESQKPEFVDGVHKMRREFNSFTELIGDGKKRKLKVSNLVSLKDDSIADVKGMQSASVKSNGTEIVPSEKISEKISLDELKKYKSALEDGLISEEEYNKVKNEFLKL